MPVAEAIHELFQRGGPFALEVELVAVLCERLEVDVRAPCVCGGAALLMVWVARRAAPGAGGLCLAPVLGGALVQLSLPLGQAPPHGLDLTMLCLQLQPIGFTLLNLGLHCRHDLARARQLRL